MTDNVIRAFPSRDIPENPLTIERPKIGFCDHQSIRVEEHKRLVVCAKCEAVIDPFDYLAYNAKHLRYAWDKHREVLSDIRELAERCQALEKEEKRLRGRVKRLQEKTGDVIATREPPPSGGNGWNQIS